MNDVNISRVTTMGSHSCRKSITFCLNLRGKDKHERCMRFAVWTLGCCVNQRFSTSPAANFSNYLRRTQRLLKAGCSFTCEWNWFVKDWSLPILVNPVWALLFCTSMRSTCPSRTSFCFLFCHSTPRTFWRNCSLLPPTRSSLHCCCSSAGRKKDEFSVW